MPLLAQNPADLVAWRHDFHRHPELMYDVFRTADRVAGLLRLFGCDAVVPGIGRTGVVGLIHGRNQGRVIGLRADMDALPIHEASAVAHQSLTPGKMHACGHDGHMAMLLGAARQLCATRDFAGTAAVIFQPAEEGGAGGKAMLDDGLMERFVIEEVFGMHNMPGLAAGLFAIRPGAMLAAADRFDIIIEGRGGHAAKPQDCIDPVLAGAQIVTALQAIVARSVDPLDACVISVTRFEAGSAYNVIPQTAALAGTVRTLAPETRLLAERRLREVAAGIGAAHGARVRVDYAQGYPVTRNHAAQTAFCAKVAAQVAGSPGIDTSIAPVMGAEDFSYMLEARPGAFIFIGNGPSAGLHHPGYDFNDAILPVGADYWVKLVEAGLAG